MTIRKKTSFSFRQSKAGKKVNIKRRSSRRQRNVTITEDESLEHTPDHIIDTYGENSVIKVYGEKPITLRTSPYYEMLDVAGFNIDNMDRSDENRINDYLYNITQEFNDEYGTVFDISMPNGMYETMYIYHDNDLPLKLLEHYSQFVGDKTVEFVDNEGLEVEGKIPLHIEVDSGYQPDGFVKIQTIE